MATITCTEVRPGMIISSHDPMRTAPVVPFRVVSVEVDVAPFGTIYNITDDKGTIHVCMVGITLDFDLH